MQNIVGFVCSCTPEEGRPRILNRKQILKKGNNFLTSDFHQRANDIQQLFSNNVLKKCRGGILCRQFKCPNRPTGPQRDAAAAGTPNCGSISSSSCIEWSSRDLFRNLFTLKVINISFQTICICLQGSQCLMCAPRSVLLWACEVVC